MGSSEMSGRPDYPWRDSPKKPVEPTSGLGPMDGRGRRSDGRDRLNANRRPASPDPAGHSRLTTKEKGSHEATYCDLPKWCCAHTTTAYARLYDAATGPPVGSGVRWWRRGRGRQMLDAPLAKDRLDSRASRSHRSLRVAVKSESASAVSIRSRDKRVSCKVVRGLILPFPDWG